MLTVQLYYRRSCEISSKTFLSSKIYVYVHIILFPFEIVALRIIVINTRFCECFIFNCNCSGCSTNCLNLHDLQMIFNDHDWNKLTYFLVSLKLINGLSKSQSIFFYENQDNSLHAMANISTIYFILSLSLNLVCCNCHLY